MCVCVFESVIYMVRTTITNVGGHLVCPQLAYCVVQFMEKDATVTEYVRETIL